jgi:uncharacterized protein YeaO (DUF488 family)
MMSDRIPAANVRLKRAYEPAAPTDGLRILVDRLWPRGVSKTEAALDLWDKDIAPSSELRRWFGHDPARWAAFRGRYTAELQARPEPLERLRALARDQTITLVYAAHDRAHTHALILREALLGCTPP